jgi:peroxiredoxin Q/BCP
MQIGKPAPSFSLPATGGSEITLSDYHNKLVVLYFYPRDNTTGCTQEGNDFSAHYDEFKKLGTEIFGISRDNIDSHKEFKIGCAFKFELLSDNDGKVCRQYGVLKEKSMFGKKSITLTRSTFLIDQHGNLAYEWRDVKVPGHVVKELAK